MFPQENRIKKKKDFEEIFRKAKSFKNTLFILRIIKNNLGINRFGFVVSLKVSKRATERNKIRRRMASAIKAEVKNIEPGLDFVLIALPTIAKKEFFEIKEAVNNALKNV